MTITESGMAVAVRFLGVAIPARADWSVVRDVLLVGRALGVEVAQGSRRKKLESAHGLRGAILERSFGVPAARTTTLTGLRDKLARKAAPQATAPAGPKSPGGTTARSKTSRNRRAVERLLRRPREFASDAALLAELAAEQVGAQQTNVPSLRKAILRKLIGRPVDDAKDADQSIRTGSDPACPTPPPAPVTHAANPTGRPTGPAEGDGPGWIKAVAAAISAATSDPRQPDADTFLRAVLRAAHACAEGWPGNRRAYIANVWRQLFETHPDWMLTDDDFKARLIEAHKAGHLTLAYADLRSKDTIELVQASAVRDRNNEWHFVRIDD